MKLSGKLQSARVQVKSLKKDLRRIAQNDYIVFRNSESGQLLKRKLYTAQEEKCNNPNCGLKLPITHLQMDHIKPISKYPVLAVEPTNFQLLCGPCNLAKGSTEE
jgi:5-methylcytosine-specific restriction endonuclease McrA